MNSAFPTFQILGAHLWKFARPLFCQPARGYHKRKLIALAGLALYVVVAIDGGKHSPRGEWYPVFNWSLFSHATDRLVQLELYVSSIGDTTFEPALHYSELGDYFTAAKGRSTNVHKLVYQIFNSRTRPEEFKRLSGLLEARYLSGHGSVSYEIRSVSFKPLDRWRSGEIIGSGVLVSGVAGP